MSLTTLYELDYLSVGTALVHYYYMSITRRALHSSSPPYTLD